MLAVARNPLILGAIAVVAVAAVVAVVTVDMQLLTNSSASSKLVFVQEKAVQVYTSKTVL